MPVEVKAIPIDQHELGTDSAGDLSTGRKLRRQSRPDSPPSQLFEPTIRDKMCFHSITVMKAYQNYSFEELRYSMPTVRRSSESMLVRTNGDGTYTATWTPASCGCYSIQASIDGYQMEEVLKVEVKEPPQGVLPPSQHNLTRKAHAHQPSKLRRFVARNSAGLRIRAHPSLQSEQIGIVHVNGTIAFMDEIHNDDGVWLRLAAETIKQYCNAAAIEAWCLQYNQHLGKTLLLPVEEPKSMLDQVISEAIMRKVPEIHDSGVCRKSTTTSHPNLQLAAQMWYQVVACGASGHNVRTRPSLYAPTLAVLSLGERVPAAHSTSDTQSGNNISDSNNHALEWCTSDGRWVRLDTAAVLGLTHAHDEEELEEAWSLAVTNTGVEYLRRVEADDSVMKQDYDAHAPQQHPRRSPKASGGSKKRGFDFTQPSGAAVAPRRPEGATAVTLKHSGDTSFTFTPSSSSGARDPAAKRKLNRKDYCKDVQQRPLEDEKAGGNPFVFGSGECAQQRGACVGTTLAPPTATAQQQQPPPRWFKTDDGRSDIPAELMGVSVKELVKVIGESRANGNGVTPPDTPRRVCSPAPARLNAHARSSSPISIPAATRDAHAHHSSYLGSGDTRSLAPSTVDAVNSSLVEMNDEDVDEERGGGGLIMAAEAQSVAIARPTVHRTTQTSPPSPLIQFSIGAPAGRLGVIETTKPTPSISMGTTAAAESGECAHAQLRVSPKAMRRDGASGGRNKRAVYSGAVSYSAGCISSSVVSGNSNPGAVTAAVKEAVAPSVAESLRAVFAAFLWHEGLVHDAMAAASYLKFHPALPKEGEPVVTRTNLTPAAASLGDDEQPEEGVRATQWQRHSLEVTGGSYLIGNIQPSTLDALTRSAANASANRLQRRLHQQQHCAIREDAAGAGTEGATVLGCGGATVAVLPPALNCLVWLWEELSNTCMQAITHHISENSPVYKNGQKVSDLLGNKGEKLDKNFQDGRAVTAGGKSTARKKQQQCADDDAIAAVGAVGVGSCLCELCGEWQPAPVTVHMRQRHPGCGRHAHGRGYNSGGAYCIGWAGNCGEGRVLVESSWYILCEACRERYVKENRGGAPAQQQPPRRKLGVFRAATSPAAAGGAHTLVRDNASFLLDLASSAAPDLGQHTNRRQSTSTSPPHNSYPYQQHHAQTQQQSQQQPFSGSSVPPYFQCLQALGVSADAAPGADGAGDTPTWGERLAEGRREGYGQYGAAGQRPLSEVSLCEEGCYSGGGVWGSATGVRVHRSVSMGTSGAPWSRTGPDGRVVLMRKRNNAGSANDIANEGASSLLCHPSAALLKLVPHLSASSSIVAPTAHACAGPALLQRPVMRFVLRRHDLPALQLAMKHALRKAMCRVYAMQALNWLVRSVTQPVCLHDLLWWFVASLARAHDTLPEPPESEDDNNVHRRYTDQHEAHVCEHPLSDVTVAGETALRPLPAAFHQLLQTVADLMVLLPAGSALQQMAVRCWGLRFSPADHSFLHRSQVFSNISKILSRSEEIEDNAVSMHECQLNTNQATASVDGSTVVETLLDISGRVEIRASSRQAMVPSLTDDSTETFWESGDEDRNKTKTLTVVVPTAVSPGPTMRPRMICVHVDNCRDLANKVSSIVFYSGPNSDELVRLRSVEVETRMLGSWFTCPIADPHDSVIRIEVKGPDNSVRIRQVRVLGEIEAIGGQLQQQVQVQQVSRAAAVIQQLNCEAETLRVFRLITSQVFGKLISGSNEQPPAHHDSLSASAVSDCYGGVPTPAGVAPEDSNDLKEHMVGILFSRSKLTHLQKQVIVHIVQAIRKETARSRDDFECAPPLCGQQLAVTSGGGGGGTDDTYCFEMLSMVLALSGSAVGRAYLGQQMGLVGDLMSLLHSGSARVQRQVTSLLRRILPEIAPEAFAKVMGVDSLPPKDFTIVSSSAAAHKESANARFDTHKPGVLDVFLGVIAKALTVQVKVTGKHGDTGAILKEVSTVTLAGSLPGRDVGGPGAQSHHGRRWWLRGRADRKLADVIVCLVKDMTAGKLSERWVSVTKGAIAENIVHLTQLGDEQRVPSQCLRTPTLWLALASLCVLDRDHVDRLSSGEWAPRADNVVGGAGERAPPRPTCSNHDDGDTCAVVQCAVCGSLCADCDRFLHLHRRTRHHQRQVCKEEESAIKLELHEGCGRTKLFWLLALADSATLKALVEWRRGGGGGGAVGTPSAHAGDGPAVGGGMKSAFEHVGVGVCRFCGATGAEGLLAIGNVCADTECQEYGRTACCKVLACGHLCGGVADEAVCLPCLHGCCAAAPAQSTADQQRRRRLRQDADDMCMICFTEALSSAPAIQLNCGHVFHLHCCKTVLTTKWSGPRITFAFSLCPICKANIEHPVLDELLAPILELLRDVRRKALMRLEYEGLQRAHAHSAGAGADADPAAYAMDRYAYYVCFKCNKAYYGGEARCDAAAGLGAEDQYDPAELVCGACSDVARAQMCPKHGTDFLEYKCRYCCSVAVFFCFGTTHFCNACHDDFQRVTNLPGHDLPACPAGGWHVLSRQCDICRQHAPSAQHLIAHRHTHTSHTRPHTCLICYKTCGWKCNLRVHMRIHTGEQPFECNICNKRFNQNSSLTLHIRSHTKEKPYECNICQKMFTTTGNLTRHMRVHTGEKPFECKVCYKRFNHSSSLTQHIRSHTKEKPSECNICQKRFTRTGNLARHILTHT